MGNYVLAAKKIAARAQRAAIHDSINSFKNFVIQPESIGILHKSLKDAPLPKQELEVGDSTIVHPADIM